MISTPRLRAMDILSNQICSAVYEKSLDYARDTHLNKKLLYGVFCFRRGLPRASFAFAKRVEWSRRESNPRAYKFL